MATQNVNIGVNVSDNGSASKTAKSVEKLHEVLKQAQKTAETLNIGGTAGSRAVASKAAPTGSQTMSGEEYGRVRGSAGATGASARDFANQAQGLGGLVRLYATYAANVFAVSAAFTALKNAADTTNLVRGLDALGASSGRNLGALSKQLVAATDGAISLRDAMSATAMTSSAGMSNENIRRLAEVAKTASLALGVSMPDAINRLSRGIVKLEPELLDELGLFTKIGPATEKYALEIGKTASQLTDFERRQAFANAVLEEGEKKFSALAEAAANPYDKLLASLKNVAQTGLELVNVVLVPIVSLLSQSPAALGAGLLAVASIVVKQALPAIGQLKEGLKNSADIALEAAKGKSGDALRARDQLNKLLEAKVEASAEFEIQKLDTLESQLTAMREKGIRKRGSLYKVLEKDLVDITDKEIAAAERSVKALETGAKKDPTKQPLATLERSTLDQLKNTIAAEEKLTALRVENRDQIEKQLQSTSQYVKLQQQVVEYETKAKKDAIVANAAYNSSLLGVRASWQLFRAEIEAADLKLKLVPASLLLIRGAMASLTNVVMALGAAINKAFFVISIAATAFSVLEMVFSKGEKQIQQFDTALSNAKDSVDNVNRTLDALKDKNGVEQSTIQTTLALSNAMTELADTAKTANKSLTEVKSATGWWDKMWEGAKGFFDKDRASELSKSMSTQISSAIELLRREGLAEEFKKELAVILNVKNLDLAQLPEILKDATEAQRQAVVNLLQTGKASLGGLSSDLQKFKEASDSSLTAYKQFTQSTADTNPLFTLGESIIQTAYSMQTLVGDTNSVAKAFDDLVKNPEKAALFGTDFVKGFAKIRKEFDQQKKGLDSYNSDITKLQDKLQSLNLEYAKAPEGTTKRTKALIDISAVQKELDEKVRLKPDTSAIDSASKLFAGEVEGAIKRGTELASRALREAQIAAGAAIAKASATALSGPRRIEVEAQIQRDQLSSQLKLIDSNISLVDVQSQTVAELRLANARAKAQGSFKPEDLQELQLAEASASIARGIKVALEGLSPQQQQQLGSQQDLQNIRNMQQQAAKTRVGGEIGALNISTNIASRRAEIQENTELSGLISNITKQYSDQLNILQSISGATSKEIVERTSLIELAQLENKQYNELQKISTDIAIAEERRVKAPQSQREAYTKEIAQLTARKGILEVTQGIEKDNVGLKARENLLKFELETIRKNFDLTKANQSITDVTQQNQIERQQELLSLTSATYGLPKEYAIEMQNILANEKARLDNARALAEVESSSMLKKQEFEARKTTLLEAGPPTAETSGLIEAAQAQLDHENKLSEASKKRLDAELAGKLAINDLQKTMNLEQEKFNTLLENSRDTSASLKALFGELGAQLGSFVEVLAESAVQSEKNASALKALGDAKDSAKDSKDQDKINAAEKAYNKQLTKNQKDEITGNIKVLSSAKTLFNEKSSAYKALDAIEKVLHLAKLARSAMEMASQAREVAATIATTVKKLPSYATEIYGQSIKQLGPIAGPVVATGLVALLFSMLGQSSPATAAPAFVPTGEQLQETQGTGMGWDAQGNKTETGGGVFGDPTQKLDSINKGIQTIKDNSIDGLRYDNRMLKALERMADSITGAARSIYASPNIRTGMGMGLDPGNFSTTPMLAEMFGKIPLVKIIDNVLGDLATSLVSGLLGGSTTSSRSIIDSGIKLVGTLEDLTKAATSDIRAYAKSRTDTQTSGGLYGLLPGRSSTSYASSEQQVSQEIKIAVAGIFDDAKMMFTTIAEMAGGSAQIVTDVFKSIRPNIDISLLNLTGEAQLKELNAVISGQLDKVSEALFSSFKQYKQFGEGLTDTVVRVIDSNQKVDVALKALGSTFDVSKDYISQYALEVMGVFGGLNVAFNQLISTSISKFDISEDIIKLAGGLENFTEQASFFIDNFLTETERMNISRQDVSKALTDLNVSTEITRDQFKQLVRIQDLSTESGRTMYQSLMDIQEAFFKITERLEGLNKTTVDLEIQLLKAQGKTQEADQALKALATEGMTSAELAVYNYNKSLQLQIDAFLKTTQTMQGLNKTTVDLEIQLLKAQGKTQEAEQALKALATEGMTSAELAVYNYNKSLQLQIDAFLKTTQIMQGLKKATVDLEIQLLKAQGKTQEAEQALKTLATEGMTSAELAVYNYNKSLQLQIDALTESSKVTNEKISLEQKLLQISGNIIALRANELEKLNKTNYAIQLQIWAIEDYSKALSNANTQLQNTIQNVKSIEDSILAIQNRATDAYVQATQQVVAAQEAIANIAIEAAKKMREFGKSLREFVNQQVGLGPTQKPDSLATFNKAVATALLGNTDAIESIPQVAQEALDAGKANAKSAQEFNQTKSAILASVIKVAKFAEQQSTLVSIPIDEDPLITANKTLETALIEQTKALNIANTLGAGLVKTSENLLEEYAKAKQDLVSSLIDKALAQETVRKTQEALDKIAFNTKDIVSSIVGASTKTALLSQELEKSLTAGLGAIDTNLDGLLTYEELKLGLAGLATDKEINDLITAVDFNKDGIIQALELETFNSTTSIIAVLHTGFNTLDTNLDGKISSQEFFQGMSGKASDKALQNIFSLIDADNDKIITSAELAAARSATLVTNTASANSLLVGVLNNAASIITALHIGFNTIDANLDGKISSQEFLQSMSGKASDAVLQSIFGLIDADNDNLISKAEINNAISSTIANYTVSANSTLVGVLNNTTTANSTLAGVLNNATSIIAVLHAGFNTLDTNLDGKISSQEFLQGMSGKASDAVLKSIFSLIDTDNDKIISSTEVAAARAATIVTNTASANSTLVGVLDSNGQVVQGIVGPNGTNTLNAQSFTQVISNTANTLLGINSLLTENKNIFTAIKAVADNTAVLANSSRPGTGVTVGQSSGGGVFNTIVPAVVATVGNLIQGVGDVASGILGGVGNFISGIFSDERTKTNISFSERLSNGISLYDYTYKEPYASIYGKDRKRGVIAQEIKDDYPNAVSVARNGMFMVDYSKLPIPGDKLKFATGGVFSNQVVTRPTSFQLGLMGEAGPEAIMPLTRTKDGGLGVVSQPVSDNSFSVELSQQNQALVAEIRQLREEVSLLRYEARATATHTNKTSKILERVTRNGESLLITDYQSL